LNSLKRYPSDKGNIAIVLFALVSIVATLTIRKK